jgi:hypothetical protein
VWPEWLPKNSRAEEIRILRDDGAEIKVLGTPLKAKTACTGCYEGWLSQLDGRVKSTVSLISNDTPILLDSAQQQILAAWIMKMALVLNNVAGRRNPPSIFYVTEEQMRFRKALEIPRLTRISIGRLCSADREMVENGFTSSYGASELKGKVMTLLSEHLIAQVVSFRLPQLASVPSEIRVSPKRGEWEEFLTPIWPHKHDFVTWPPVGSFGKAGLNAFLLER